MGDHGSSARDLARLRRGAHEFMCRYAALAWEHKDDGDRWEINLPPDIAVLPEHRRFRVHARQESRRLASAQLYDLTPEITGRVVRLGTAIYQGRHEEVIALTGHPGIMTARIGPPAASGFLRWQEGIGHNALGAPIVACHWGAWLPSSDGGQWVAWWADLDAVATGYEAEARADGQRVDFGFMAQVFGPLWYDHQELLCPGNGSAPEPEAAAADAPDGEAGTPCQVLRYIMLATWWLLNCPGAVQLSRQPLPAAEQAADHAAGLCPGPVTVVQAAGSSR